MKVVFVHGKFEILHPGHLRLLKFAKESGDKLVVGVYSDKFGNYMLPQDIRLETIEASVYVDEVFVLDELPEEYISKTKPNIVVKGSEFEDRYNPEAEIVKSYGGKLVFSSGDMKFSSLALLRQEMEGTNFSMIERPESYLRRNNIAPDSIARYIDRFKGLNVAVIGDTIVDEYISCEPYGMSQEDPTIVVGPISYDKFIGGAAIVASHASSLGAKVDFFTVTGNDEYGKYAREKTASYGVNMNNIIDDTRPTTLKQRYRANGKSLLRVNHLKQHHIAKEIQKKMYDQIVNCILEKDLVVFSDFSYGCLPQSLVEKIISLCETHSIMMVADSQSSSQTGDISRFRGMNLVTPTEREARLAVQDFESGLIVLAEKLRAKSNMKNIFITLGAEGIVLHENRGNSDNNKQWHTDQLPALNSSPKDVAGAGDSLLISASMALVLGASVVEAAYIGSLAAATQVSRVGNIPLKVTDIKKEL